MLCLEVYAIFQTLEILNQDSHLRGCHKSGNLFIRIEEAFKVPPNCTHAGMIWAQRDLNSIPLAGAHDLTDVNLKISPEPKKVIN